MVWRRKLSCVLECYGVSLSHLPTLQFLHHGLCSETYAVLGGGGGLSPQPLLLVTGQRQSEVPGLPLPMVIHHTL